MRELTYQIYVEGQPLYEFQSYEGVNFKHDGEISFRAINPPIKMQVDSLPSDPVSYVRGEFKKEGKRPPTYWQLEFIQSLGWLNYANKKV